MKFLEGLQLLFIYLKLTHQIGWPWWAVLLPFFWQWLLNLAGTWDWVKR